MPRRFRKLHLLWLVIGLLAGLVAWRWYFPAREVAPQTLPNPNGYDDFVKAGNQIIGQFDDVSKLEESELTALISTNAESLRLARVGLTRACEVPFDPTLPSQDLIDTRKVAFLLVAEGRLAELQGRPVDAAGCYIDVIQMGNTTSHGGLIIHRLVSIAMENIGYSKLVKVVPKLDGEQIKPLVQRLQAIDQQRVDWTQVIHSEKRYVRFQSRKVANPLHLVSTWWQSRAVNKKAREKHDTMVARLRLMMIQLALRCHQTESGQAPQRLEQLSLLRTVPSDPFTGQPFRYAATGTNWLLYSIGADLVDDRGRGVSTWKTGSAAKGDLFFDSPP